MDRGAVLGERGYSSCGYTALQEFNG